MGKIPFFRSKKGPDLRKYPPFYLSSDVPKGGGIFSRNSTDGIEHGRELYRMSESKFSHFEFNIPKFFLSMLFLGENVLFASQLVLSRVFVMENGCRIVKRFVTVSEEHGLINLRFREFRFSHIVVQSG